VERFLSSSATAAAIEKATIPPRPQPVQVFREQRRAILCLLLVLITLAIYNPVAHNGFTNFDDNGYITENVHIRAGLTWETVKWAFESKEGANWHPLTWLSHALDCQLFKLNPVGHHYVNVLLHAANAVLLFLLLEVATGFTWPSFVVATLFALHPVNVESVAWASERKNVLSMLFFLLTLHAYHRYARKPGFRRYAVVFVLFPLGLLAKPEIITLPFVLLLWDYWPLQRMSFGHSIHGENAVIVPRSFSYLAIEKVPLLLLSAASAVITLWAQEAGYAVRDASNRVRFGNALVAYVRYLGKAFWPSRLAAMYPHLGRFLPTWQIIGSAAVLLVITTLVVRFRDHRYLVLGWFWFLGTLVPVIGLVQVGVQAMADRYAYLSFIGLFICVAWGTEEFAKKRRIRQQWLAFPAVLIFVSFGMVTRHQIAYWHDSETLWRHVLAVTNQNYFAHNTLAYALEAEGRTDDAIAEFNASEALHAYPPSALISVGIYEQTHGHTLEAIEQYQQSLKASSDAKSRAEAMGHLGSAYMQMGDLGRARMSFQSALAQDPDAAVALVGSGLLAERAGDLVSAEAQISHAMRVAPTDIGYLILAQVLRLEGRTAEADAGLGQAQRISKNFVQARQAAAHVMASAGIKAD
jgi:protein O-mannosyl-transferase